MTVTVQFGGDHRERVAIEVSGYSHPGVQSNIYDANWLRANVSVDAGSFSGQFAASFLTGDFQTFEPQVANMYESLKGTAKFETLEGQLMLELSCNALGAVTLEGV